MIFPACRTLPRRLPALAGPLLLAAGLMLGTGAASADDDPVPGPPLHAVTYTIFTERPFANAEIYYRDVDPPNFAAYSNNPYVFSPNVEANVGPDQMWIMNVMLANPDDWAMVTASSLDSPQQPNFHCVIAVDGEVVVTNQGPRGALCSLRNW